MKIIRHMRFQTHINLNFTCYHVEEPDGTKKENPESNNKNKIQEDNCNDNSSHISKGSAVNLKKSEDVLAEKAHKAMKRRLRYDWKISDFVYNFFSPITYLLCYCCMRKNRLNAQTRMKLYQKGEAKFIKEFDAVYYARCMRNLNTLVDSLMDDSERFMITYQKRNCISIYEDSEDDNSGGNYEDVPQMFERSKKKEHLIKVDDFMEQYK